jgi:hypothetical protein
LRPTTTNTGSADLPIGVAGQWQDASMAVSRADRRREREGRVVAVFGKSRAPRVLDLLELVELAWHDCYGDITPPEEIIDDILLLSDGSIEGLIVAARLGVADWRDLRVAANARRDHA